MTLAKLTNRQYPAFPSWIDRFFEGDLMDWNTWNFSENNTTMPAINVRENDEEYKIEVAAPGMKKDDFKVNYENGRLTISSERKEEKKEKNKDRLTRCEFSYSTFQRSFTVPENTVDTDKISARYDEGILYLILPKREEIRPKPGRQIKIG